VIIILIVGRVQLLVIVFLCTGKIEHIMTATQQLRTPLISGFICLFPFPTLSEAFLFLSCSPISIDRC
jgi:hypothetical protein